MGASEPEPEQEPDSESLGKQVAREFRWWGTGSFLGWLSGAFMLFLTITNFVHAHFHIQLWQPFEVSLNGLRLFAHFLMDKFIFSWLTLLLAQAWYGITLALSHYFHEIHAWIPHIRVAAWYKDLGLISAVMFSATMRGFEPAPIFEGDPFSEELRQALMHQRRIVRAFVQLPVAIIGALLMFLAFCVFNLSSLIAKSTSWVLGQTVGKVALVIAQSTLSAVTMSGLLCLPAFTTLIWTATAPPKFFSEWIRLSWLTLLVACAFSAVFLTLNGYFVPQSHS